MSISVLTPLQLDAAAGLLQNQGIAINGNMVIAINDYESTALIAPFLNTITLATANSILSNAVIGNLETLAANSCPALSDSVPTLYNSIGNVMTEAILAQANKDICANNVSQLAQASDQASGYASISSLFINSAVNSQTYLGNTFTNMNNMITGDVTTINLATVAFGQDLQNLGQLINLNNLDNFGSPLALIQQILSITGTIPVVSLTFVAVGIPTEIVLNLDSPTISVTDSIQKLMYTAMTQITGNDLDQILSVLGVKTIGIKTMADLLNPVKLFPNSYQSLTVSGSPFKTTIAIYVDSSGAINQNLLSVLPEYVLTDQIPERTYI